MSTLNQLPNISTVQIEAFLTLASTLNFTKAAVALHTTQPNLSKMIVRLEDELEVKLFIRNRRSVRLTSAGKYFQQRLGNYTESFLGAILDTKAISTNHKPPLNIAMLGTAVLNELPIIIHQFTDNYPNVPISITDYPLAEIKKNLKDNNIDIALVPKYVAKDMSEFKNINFLTDDMYLVTDHHNPLGLKQSVKVEELADQTLIIPDFKPIRDIFEAHHISPTIIEETESLNNVILKVESGLGISIFAGHLAHYYGKNLSFVKLEGYEDFFKINCVWKNEYNESIQNFVSIVQDFVEDR
ncbi:LysR family transcriptional regulator [Agrilactobacillus yilanensis]|uniref:LysR family transcriptional regulator n=1 Tax=Agrilactobacillus yilanensis TaxID=2485997 RepID=A0ABW4J6W6_9LACO|nr:LysR family transcriptional regulator [Agrilactobacillus yilanensis]